MTMKPLIAPSLAQRLAPLFPLIAVCILTMLVAQLSAVDLDPLGKANEALKGQNDKAKATAYWVIGLGMLICVVITIWQATGDKNMKVIVPAIICLVLGSIGLTMVDTIVQFMSSGS